jgi:hypothetical protein
MKNCFLVIDKIDVTGNNYDYDSVFIEKHFEKSPVESILINFSLVGPISYPV